MKEKKDSETPSFPAVDVQRLVRPFLDFDAAEVLRNSQIHEAPVAIVSSVPELRALLGQKRTFLFTATAVLDIIQADRNFRRRSSGDTSESLRKSGQQKVSEADLLALAEGCPREGWPHGTPPSPMPGF